MDLSKVKKILKKYHVLLAVQYGSSLKSKYAEDYDIALYLKNNRNKISSIQRELEMIFDKPLDLVELSERTDPLLAYEILSTGKPLYEEKKDLFENLLVQIWKKYLDTQKFRDLENAYIKKGIKRVTRRH